MSVYIDMADFPDDVYASALKFERYAKRHFPRGREAWLGLALKIGIPQEHLEIILARIFSQDVEIIRALYRAAGSGGAGADRGVRMKKKDARKAAHALDAYMRFRAAQEGMRYDLTPEWLRQGIMTGCRAFFGVVISEDGKLVEDVQQPELFARWTGERTSGSVH